MAQIQSLAAKHWRVVALVLLFLACIVFKAGALLFWAGYTLLLLTSTDGRLIVLSAFLILGIPVAFRVYGPGQWALIVPEIMMAIGFAASVYLGFAIYRQNGERPNTLKNF